MSGPLCTSELRSLLQSSGADLVGFGPDHHLCGGVRWVQDPSPPQDLRHPQRAGLDWEISPAGHAGVWPGGTAELCADGRAL